MKNPAPQDRAALAQRARSIAQSLPELTCTAQGTLSDASRGAVSMLARRILAEHRAVGCTLVVCPPDAPDLVWCFGRARLSPSVPVSPDTCFRVASVSKIVMTFGALALCSRSLLSLDGDIGDVLGYPVRNPHAPDTPVTLRMLLTHTASLCDEGSYGSRGMQPGCCLRELLDHPGNWLPAAPGAAFHYSNLGAGVVGVMMELVTGLPLDTLMQQLVFLPLGIRASYDPRQIVPSRDLADGYSVRFLFPYKKYDAEKLAARPPEPFLPEQDYLTAAGRLITDASGMARLVRLLASHGELGVLDPEWLDLMRTPQDGLGGITGAGRGLNTAFLPDVFDGFSPVGHQGVAYGMCAEYFADAKKGCGVGVMTNGVRLVRQPPLIRAGFDLLALGFAVLARIG